MTPFALTTTVTSLALFAGFVALSVAKFGWQPSYSAFAAKWMEAVPLNDHTHLWSIVTLAVAFLLAPALLELGNGDPRQALGFFAPLYLCVVAFTPQWEAIRRQHVIHTAGAVLCAAAALAWIVLVRHAWWAVALALFAAWCAAYLTDTMRKSTVFWLEMAMFAATYSAIMV